MKHSGYYLGFFGASLFSASRRQLTSSLASCCMLLLLSAGTGRAQFTNDQPASLVIGQTNFTRNGDDNLDSLDLNQANGVAVDPTNGQVYVADTYNNRVLRFANAASYVNGAGAIGVLGQKDFHSSRLAVGANGMYNPWGVVVDGAGNLYVADTYNRRVLKFSHAVAKSNGASADTVLGQADFSSTNYTIGQAVLGQPQGIAVDNEGDLFVADNDVNRVMIFLNAATKGSGANADIVLGQPDFTSSAFSTSQSSMSLPYAVAVDTSGNLYVADNSNSRVLRFANAISKSNGANADGVLGQVDFVSSSNATTQSGMSYPTGVAVDRSGNLFVADGSNQRVLKFSHAASKANGANADTVLGQPNFNSSSIAVTQSGMEYPAGLAIDTSENLYVVDFNNNRVLRFGNAAKKGNGANADAVLGHAAYNDPRPNNLDSIGLNQPLGLAVDPKSGALYVVDYENNRVLRYASALSYVSGHGAIGVLGEPDFGANTGGLGLNLMYEPTGAAVDTAGNLYVADQGNNRVLIYKKASSKANGASADIVLGQPDANSGQNATTQSGMYQPTFVAVDKAGNLYVSDLSNNRVLKFSNASAKTTGANADVVLGQTDFISNGTALTQAGMDGPRGLAVDQKGNLYVADYINHRVLKFANAAAKASGANADVEFGQPDFVSQFYESVTQNNFDYPYGAAVDDAGTLYICDSGNNRIMIFLNASAKANDANADAEIGQTDFSGGGTGLSQTAMNGPLGVAVNSSTGTLYVADYANNRVLVFNATGALAVQLYEFTSSIEQSGHVVLQWSTATETNNYGFYVERSSSASAPFEQLADNFVAGHGTTLQPQAYSWIDTSALTGTYYYRLQQVDLTGAVSYSKPITIHVNGVEGVKDGKNLPKEFSLSQNYPNPFNPSTQIEYALTKSAHVSLMLYNMLGERVATLVNENEEAGYKSVRFDGSNFASGTYFCRIEAGTFTSVRKILLMK